MASSATLTVSSTVKRVHGKPFTKASACSASVKGVAVRTAKRAVVQEISQIDTVSKDTRRKMGALVKWISNRVKPSQVVVKTVGDLHKLAQVAEIVHGWSAKDSRQAHLHLHDVGRLVQSTVQSDSDSAKQIDSIEDKS